MEAARAVSMQKGMAAQSEAATIVRVMTSFLESGKLDARDIIFFLHSKSGGKHQASARTIVSGKLSPEDEPEGDVFGGANPNLVAVESQDDRMKARLRSPGLCS
jgi:hypothetical protein